MNTVVVSIWSNPAVSSPFGRTVFHPNLFANGTLFNHISDVHFLFCLAIKNYFPDYFITDFIQHFKPILQMSANHQKEINCFFITKTKLVLLILLMLELFHMTFHKDFQFGDKLFQILCRWFERLCKVYKNLRPFYNFFDVILLLFSPPTMKLIFLSKIFIKCFITDLNFFRNIRCRNIVQNLRKC